MPYAIVVYTYPRSDLSRSHTEGRMLHAMFLDLLREVDPARSDALHGSRSVKPFTIGPLRQVGSRRTGERDSKIFPAGTECSIRFTLLEDDLFSVLTEYFLSGRSSLRLGGTDLMVSRLLTTPESGDPMAGCATFEEVWERARDKERRIGLRFLSPTAFRQGDQDLPLPVPSLVFRSWLVKWNRFAPYRISEGFAEYIERHIRVCGHRIATRPVIDARSLSLGFVGSVNFEVLERAGKEFIRQANVLADFGFYAGTGKKTTMGMGQTVRHV